MSSDTTDSGGVGAIFRPAPSASSLLDVSLFGERAHMPIRFYLWRDVLVELRRAARVDPSRHSVCVLTGSYGLANDGPFMEVDGFEGFLSYDHLETPEVTLHDHLHALFLEGLGVSGDAGADQRSHNAGSGPLGFFYHAPHSGALLDETIVRLHLSLCNIPYQLVLISDLLDASHQVALYTRRTREPFVNTSFYMLSRRELAMEEE